MAVSAGRARTWWTVTIGGTALAAAAEVAMFWLQAPHHPQGGPSTSSLSVLFLDLFVVIVAAIVACVSAAAAFWFAYAVLDRTTLWKTSALVYAAVLVELVAVGQRDPVNAWLLSYPTMIVAGLASRWLFAEPSRESPGGSGAGGADAQVEIAAILRLRDDAVKNAGGFDYGANVLPVLRRYAALDNAAARKRLQDALEQMLASDDADVRTYAVDVCLGFVAFRHAI